MRRCLLLVLLAAAVASAQWFRSPPLLALAVAGSDHVADEECRNHSRLFLRRLENYTLWAVQMFDASTKLPQGVLDGDTYQMGHYDECLRVSAEDVRGQYCLVELSYQPLDYRAARPVDPYEKNFDPRLHVWEKLKSTQDYTKLTRDVIHWALCLPASCRPPELQRVLDHELAALGRARGLNLSAHVSARLCSVSADQPPFTVAEIAYSGVVGALVFLLFASTGCDLMNYSSEETNTTLDIERKNSTMLARIFLCFSVRRSLKSVLTTRNHHPATDSSNGPRFLFMILIIFGHRLAMYVGHPVDDAYYIETLFLSVGNAFMVNGPLLVDSYLVVSGMLLTYYLLQELDKNDGANLAQALLLRYVRLTPVYMLVVFFHATVFYRMGSGPFWEEIVGTDRDRCQTNWWTNLLYVNNYVHVDGMCMFQSWYLSCDFQLCAVSLLVVYAVWRWPRLGYPLLAVLCAASALVPFLAVLWSRADAILLPIARNIRDPVDNWYFQDIYIKTHNRAAPYFAGVIVGLVMFKMRSSKFKFGKVTSHGLFAVLVWLLGSASMLSAYVFFDPARPYDAVEAALYASLHRVGFGLSIACYFLLIAFGQLDVYERVFSWAPFRMLSRLSYAAYLVHTVGQLYDHGSLRSSRATTLFSIAWMSISDCTFAFVAAFVLLIVVEAPFRAIEKTVFGRK